MVDRNLAGRFYPEANVGGFSYEDSSVAFFTQINAIIRQGDRILDFGAGRGEHIEDDPVSYRRSLFNLQGKCAHVEGCDVDDAVLGNPYVDHATVYDPSEPLPFANNTFDIVYSRFVWEHIENAGAVAAELLRITKPGGTIASLTPNKRGYIAVAGRAVPNNLHVRALKRIQPNRKAVDVFPTRYQLNTPRAIRKAFGGEAVVHIRYFCGEPAYHFGNAIIYGITKWWHKHMPDSLRPLLIIYVRKR